MTVDFLTTFRIVLPLFAVIAGGWGLSSWFSVDEESITRILTDFFMPLLVFGSLYHSNIETGEMLNLLGTVIFIIISLYAVSLLYSRIAKTELRSIALPVIFMNSGYIGIPLMQLWGGNEAMNIIIVFDQIETLFLFTFGFFILGGGLNLRGLRLSLLSPILWAVVLGLTANLLKLPLPAVLLDTCTFAGTAAAPLAAFVVGCSLSSNKPIMNIHVAWGIFLRMAIGPMIGIAAVVLFNLQGLTGTVVIVASALPSAVFSYVLPLRYGTPSEEARSIVIISTVLSILIIPLAFSLASFL